MDKVIRVEIDTNLRSIRTCCMQDDGKWSDDDMRQFEDCISMYSYLTEYFSSCKEQAKKSIENPKKYLAGLYDKLDRAIDAMAEIDAKIEKIKHDIDDKQKFLNYMPSYTCGAITADPLSSQETMRTMIKDRMEELRQLNAHKTEVFNKYQELLTEIKNLKQDED